MNYVWAFVNSLFVLLMVLEGYNSLSPDRLRHTNSDAFVCIAILIVTAVFNRECLLLALPTKRRQTSQTNSEQESLQLVGRSLAIAVYLSLCIDRRHTFNTVAFWTFGVFCSFTNGLLVGQLLVLVFRIYRDRIAPTT